MKNVRIKSNLEILGFTVFKGAIRGFVQNPMLCGIEGCEAESDYVEILRDSADDPQENEEDFLYEPDIEQHEDEEKYNGN